MSSKKPIKTRNKDDKQEITSDHDGAVKTGKSGQEVAKKKSAQKSKTHRDYWLSRLIKGTYTVNGESRMTADWHMRVSCNSVRKLINLKTPNKATAAEKAAKFWRDLASGGWKLAEMNLNPGAEEKKPEKVTVGRLIEVSHSLLTVRPESFESYAKALRKLASDITGIKGTGKFDASHGAVEWRKKVDSIPLEKLTPTAVFAWKNTRMRSVSRNADRNSMAVTVNSILRGSKAIVGKKIRPFIEKKLNLPLPLWFEGVPMEAEPSLRYQSRIDEKKLIGDAQVELLQEQPELFKALMLTLVFGLRRSEADTLLWSQLDLEKGTLSIHDTDFKKLKSKDSAGIISIDKELVSLLVELKSSAKGEFVLETPSRSRIKTGTRKSRSYRCDATLNALGDWLKGKGVTGKRPLHTLRKEIGSIIASKQGIYKASRYLRHSDIRITAKLYADTKEPVSAGVGGLFAVSDSPIDAAEDKKVG